MANKKKNSKSNNPYAGRRGKTKRVRKESDKILEVGGDTDINISKAILVGSCIILFFCLFYFITVFYTKDDSVKEDNKGVSISYSEIVLGRSFDMADDHYYVLYYDKSNEDDLKVYPSIVSQYKSKEDSIPLYVVNMGDAMNSSFKALEGNSDADDASQLKINGPTLIEFEDHKINSYAEGEEEINSYLS